MIIDIHLWAEVISDWKKEGIYSGPDRDITPEQLADITNRFDIMISSRGGEKVLHVAPLGRGFGQRG